MRLTPGSETAAGETRCLTEWAEIARITRAKLRRRLAAGKTLEDVFEEVKL